MPRGMYFIALMVVSASLLVQLASVALTWLGARPPHAPITALAHMFSHPLPGAILYALPGFARDALVLAFAALVARRLLVLLRTRSFVPPPSYSKWPRRLLLVAVASLGLMAALLLLALVTAAPLGVIAGLLGLPAVLLLSPVVFYVEARSLAQRDQV